MKIKLKTTVLLLLPIGLGGCVSTKYARRDAGFATVSDTVAVAATKQTVWIQNKQQAQAISDKVKDLVARKPLDVDTAVQVALLNNRGLQAAYANLGDGAADAWQSTMLINPTVALGLTGIGTPELESWRAFEGMVATNILALATRKKNIEIADDRFRQAQLGAAVATLTLAADTRRAWINAVSALESVGQLQRAQAAADAASELASNRRDGQGLTSSRTRLLCRIGGSVGAGSPCRPAGEGRTHSPYGTLGHVGGLPDTKQPRACPQGAGEAGQHRVRGVAKARRSRGKQARTRCDRQGLRPDGRDQIRDRPRNPHRFRNRTRD
jgi:hypothetical protein